MSRSLLWKQLKHFWFKLMFEQVAQSWSSAH